MKLFILILGGLLYSRSLWASAHLTDYTLRQCDSSSVKCIELKAQSADESSLKKIHALSNVELVITEKGKKDRIIKAARGYLDLTTQLISLKVQAPAKYELTVSINNLEEQKYGGG